MSNLSLQTIRKTPASILAIGNYSPGTQSIIDFDYLCGKKKPSIVGIISSGRRFEKFFWGNDEVLIPCFTDCKSAREALGSVDWMLNISSGRRTYRSTVEFFEAFPDARGGHLFAENIPEKDAVMMYDQFQAVGKLLIGPAGVGLIVPGHLKLGVIGGIDWRQLQDNKLAQAGSVAVLSASGGMVNEFITQVVQTNHAISFALCFGGDRFPLTTPAEAFLAAEADPSTSHIVYYGELGGKDEYDVVELINSNKVTKPIVAYIAGIIGENFDQPVQFGHAKALAASNSETASAKRSALESAGVTVAQSVKQFVDLIGAIPTNTVTTESTATPITTRRATPFTSTISSETPSGYAFLGKTLPAWAFEGDFVAQITTGILGHAPKSTHTVDLLQTIFLLSVDHGPQVSGALTTIITARAGKNLIDSLAAGLMTIGPRFGGAVSGAAAIWLAGIIDECTPKQTVETYARRHEPMQGIGHKKYRLGLPDPRTVVIQEKANEFLADHRFINFARSVETITTAKKGNLILNVDGLIAAAVLDTLEQEEGYSLDQLQRLVDTDFFNALFVIPRTVGFISHYLDQKRLDEGLFRLPDDDILLVS